jgi:hypothetical protein
MKVMWAYLLIVQSHTWQWLRSIRWLFILKTLGISTIILTLAFIATFLLMKAFNYVVSQPNSLLLTSCTLIVLMCIGTKSWVIINERVKAVKSKPTTYKEFRNDC